MFVGIRVEVVLAFAGYGQCGTLQVQLAELESGLKTFKQQVQVHPV